MSTLRDWAELLRVSALFTVPGDVVAGATAAGKQVDRRAVRAIGCSLCLYEAGMALNDFTDRDEDARERPHRPLPSGRIRPRAALAAAVRLTGAGPARSTGTPTAAHEVRGIRRAGSRATVSLAAAYIATSARPLLHAALNPSPHLTQRAVGGGIRALIPLQAALAARAGSLAAGAALTALVPMARSITRTVSPT